MSTSQPLPVSTSTTFLGDLLSQARGLNTHLARPDLPQIQFGLDEVENQSRKLVNKQRGEVDSRAHYLLASGGLNASELAQKIGGVNANLAATFEPLQPLHDNDVEGYLRHEHEQIIVSAIEEGRRETLNDFYTTLSSNMQRDWERRKRAIFDELGQHANASPDALGESSFGRSTRSRTAAAEALPSAPSTLAMHTRMMAYDGVVKRLNEYRLQGYNFGLVSTFHDATRQLAQTDQRAAGTLECWALLQHTLRERAVIGGEFQRAALKEREYAGAYLRSEQESEEARGLRRSWAEGAREFLEEQFTKHVEKLIMQYPAQAEVGGVPSIHNKIRGYINIKYRKGGQWSDPKLEIIGGQPLWATLFLLLRSGHPHEALELAAQSEDALPRPEREFVPYFKAWLDSPDRRLPKQLRDRFLATYNTRIRFAAEGGSIDPYKHALYKLIGRAELSRRNLPIVTQTTEDWLWLQLALVRESAPGEDPPAEQFGLRELAALLVRFGANHFDPKGNAPVKYFKVLLLSGQYERAIAFLYNTSQHQVDSVQFAVALAYYGLLRVPEKSQTSEIELLTLDASGQPALDFARILHRYTRLFARSDPYEALQYLYLICLSADAPPPIGEQQVALCHAYIKDLVLETRAYAQLLGDIKQDGSKVPGAIERDLKLIRLRDEREYLLNIVKAAAARAESEKRVSDAILLYNLADEYDTVVAVLNRELGASLAQPASAHVQPPPMPQGSLAATDDIVALARSILDHYVRTARIAHRVSQRNRETCAVLLRLKEAMATYEEGALEAALSIIEEVNLLPLDGELVTIKRKAEEFKDVDEPIARNFSDILLVTMNILYKIYVLLKESPYGDASRQNKLAQIRAKARAVHVFAGMLKFRISGDVFQQINRLDVMMT